MSEAVFKKEVEKVIEFYEEIICHAASRARNMIRDYREVEAISRLVVNADLQQGFKVLRDHARAIEAKPNPHVKVSWQVGTVRKLPAPRGLVGPSFSQSVP
jgi:hypothetical protein